MNKRKFWFVVLLISACMVTAVFAAYGNKQATLYYNNIKIMLDGTELVPTDATGKIVEPFVIDGTTYLPVRGIGNALGLDVAWDGKNWIVFLTRPESPQPVYMTRTGSKYHHESACNGGTYYEVPLESAVSMGLEPCTKCVMH